VSHAKWPDDNAGHAPEQTGIVICRALETVAIECRPSRLDELTKRTKKL
jgi:hypothetical protein